MRNGIFIAAALAALGATASPAVAQTVTTQPINPTAAVVPAANTAANVAGTGIRGLGQIVAGTLEDNAIVRSLNRLFGRTITTPTQPGFSPLPQPSAYQSTRYQNSFRPMAPVNSTFGRNPTSIFPK